MKKVECKLHPNQIGVLKTFSLSPDDKIGEIAVECTGATYYYNNLEELCRDWEDVEEPKVYYYISDFGAIRECKIGRFPEDEEDRKLIGNYFTTKEEAERALEKLKAIKRLKDKGFEFNYVGEYENLCGNGFEIPITAIMPPEQYNKKAVAEDLAMLFER